MVYVIACLCFYVNCLNLGNRLSHIYDYLRAKIECESYKILNIELFEKLRKVELFLVEDQCISL
jgi:hypothetical protein